MHSLELSTVITDCGNTYLTLKWLQTQYAKIVIRIIQLRTRIFHKYDLSKEDLRNTSAKTIITNIPITHRFIMYIYTNFCESIYEFEGFTYRIIFHSAAHVASIVKRANQSGVFRYICTLGTSKKLPLFEKKKLYTILLEHPQVQSHCNCKVKLYQFGKKAINE